MQATAEFTVERSKLSPLKFREEELRNSANSGNSRISILKTERKTEKGVKMLHLVRLFTWFTFNFSWADLNKFTIFFNFFNFCFRQVTRFHVHFVVVPLTHFKKCSIMSEVNILNWPNNNGHFVQHVNVVFRIQKLCKSIRTDAKARKFVNFAETNLFWSKHVMHTWKNIIWSKSSKFGIIIASFAKNHFQPTTNCSNTWKPLIQTLPNGLLPSSVQAVMKNLVHLVILNIHGLLIRSMSKTTGTLVNIAILLTRIRKFWNVISKFVQIKPKNQKVRIFSWNQSGRNRCVFTIFSRQIISAIFPDFLPSNNFRIFTNFSRQINFAIFSRFPPSNNFPNFFRQIISVILPRFFPAKWFPQFFQRSTKTSQIRNLEVNIVYQIYHYWYQLHNHHLKNESDVQLKIAINISSVSEQCTHTFDPDTQPMPKTTGQLVHFVKNYFRKRTSLETIFNVANSWNFTRLAPQLVLNWWFAPNARLVLSRSSICTLFIKSLLKTTGWNVEHAKLISRIWNTFLNIGMSAKLRIFLR